MDNYYAVIMAGGGGTRLWPLSRQSRPKQMLSLVEESTMFQGAVRRLKGLFIPENIFVVTVQDQAPELQAQCPEIPSENFILEPMPRGTASVVGLAAVALRQRNPQAVMAVLTADHYIGNEQLFHQLLSSAYQVAQDGYLVTLGIVPTFAATGFGYIQKGEQMDQCLGLDVFHVRQFKEKPSQAQAEVMIAGGDHSWNSGMFVWRVSQVMEEFNHQMPDLAHGLQEISQAWGTPDEGKVVENVWQGLPNQTIDYGIMEGARRVVVISAAGLRWNDVGSWDSLFDVLESDQDGNIVMGGRHVGLDTQNSLIYVCQEHRLIVTIGVENLVVVDTGDVLLVCSKDQAQRVRQVVDRLKESGKEFV